MALDENLSNIISQILAPHINEMHKSNMTFRQTASEHNDNLKQIVSQIYNAINYNNNNINSMLSSVESVNQQNQQMSMEMRSLASAINQNNMSLNNLLNHFNSFSNVTRRSMNRQTSIFSNFSESFGLFSKRFQVSMGMLGKRATGGAAIGTGAIQTGAAIAGIGAAAAAGGAAYFGTKQYESIQQARASQAEAAEDLPRTGPSRRERETAESETRTDGSVSSETSSLSGNLAEDRKAKFAKELENNPELMKRLYNLARTEVGANPKDQQKFIETVFNRAMFSNKSISSIVSSVGKGKYYPGIKNFKPSKETLDNFNSNVIGGVMKGSDMTDLATDNASNAPGNPVAERRIRAGARGKWLGETKQKEYYYSASTGKYKTQHGINRDKYKERIERENKQGKPDATPAPGTSSGQPSSGPQPSGQPSSGQPSDATRTEFDPNKGKYTSESVRSRSQQLSPEAQAALGRFQQFNPNDTISSTYRSPTHKIERDKPRGPGAHTKGNAIDVSTRGKSKQELENIIQGLKKSGFNHILLEGRPPHIHAEIRPGRGFNIHNYNGGHPGLSLEEARRAAEQVQRQEPPKPEQQAPQPKPQQQPSPVPPEQPKPKPEPGKMLPSGLLKPDTEQRLRGQEPTPAPTPPPKTGAELNMRGTQEETQRGQPQPQQTPTPSQQPQGEQAPQTPAPQNVQPTTATASWVPKTGSQDYSNLAAYYGQKNIHDSYIQRGSQIV